MSGHITITSRGSSVGSSSSRCRTHRAGPRPGGRGRGRRGPGRCGRLRVQRRGAGRVPPGAGGPGGWRSSRTSACIRASSVSVVCAAELVVMVDVRSDGSDDELELAGVPTPRGEQPVDRQSGGGVSATVHDRGLFGERLAHPAPQRRGRVEEEQVDLAHVGDRPEHVEVRARHPRQTEQRQSLRQVEQLGLGLDPLARRRQPLRGAGSTDPAPEPSPQLGLPAFGAILAGGPGAQHRRGGTPRSGRTGRRCGGSRRSGGWRRRARRVRPRGAGPAPPATARRGTRRRLRAVATPNARAATGPGRARSPWRPTPRRGSAGPGTGSRRSRRRRPPRPAVVPSRVESRWVSHRSIPRVGTAMISGAKGPRAAPAASRRGRRRDGRHVRLDGREAPPRP